MSKQCFIETYGCQMNKADSERMLGLLNEIGYSPTDTPDNADLLLLNTCTIREGAGDRAFSNLGRWKIYKEKNPNVLIGMGGCLAQEKGKEVQRRLPHVDIVFGTHNLHRLPILVHNALTTQEKQCELFDKLTDEVPETPIIRQTSVTAWVNIILGCNFNCTYCIVPQVRGREISRTPAVIKQEIQKLVDEGHKEVTLLGQNVTAYGHDLDDKNMNLARLLEDIHDVNGLQRIRFLTGHPYHVNDDLIETVASLPKVCEQWHLPMQSGNDTVLRRMARVYTSDYYRKMAEKIRSTNPKSVITSDFIVGFPGETHEQFIDTCKIVEEFKFSSCMTAMYSPRRNTPGARWEKDPELKISDREKHDRIRYLNAVVTDVAEQVSVDIHKDTVQELLIEEISDKNTSMLMGRTRSGKPCYIPREQANIGDLINVQIHTVNPWTLYGDVIK